MRKLLPLLLLLAWLGSAEGAITRGVGPVTNTALPSTTCVLTLPGTTTGNALVVAVVWYNDAAQTISSVTVSGESAATVIAGSKADNATVVDSTQLAYHPNLTSGGSKTITVTMSASTYISCGVMEYAGLDTASQPDASTHTSGTDSGGTTTCVASLTTTTDSALIVGVCSQNGQPTTAGSGYTKWVNPFPDTGSGDADVMDKVNAGVAGVKTVNFVDPYNSWSMSAASFKASTGGGGGGGPAPSATAHRRIQ